MMNVIAVFVCTACAAAQLANGHWVWCIVDLLLALLNVPMAIEWIRENQGLYNTE